MKRSTKTGTQTETLDSGLSSRGSASRFGRERIRLDRGGNGSEGKVRFGRGGRLFERLAGQEIIGRHSSP